MKKGILLTILIVVILAVAIAAVWFFTSPEYTLLKMRKDVQEQGIAGIKPYLTENGQEAMEKITSLAENDLVGLIVGLLGKEDAINTFTQEIQQIHWELDDIIKSSKNARVILAFNYKEKLTGTIEISMVRQGGEWRIDGVKLPEFDSFGW